MTENEQVHFLINNMSNPIFSACNALIDHGFVNANK